MPTTYTFTQPIRYFKANDPYYYEVDNIPLRQLEENILYVKNKLAGHGEDGTFLTDSSEISIYNIKELRPKPIGGRTVQVNGGRFVARVNDAFNITDPLTRLKFLGNPQYYPDVIPNLQVWWTTGQKDKVWNNFIGTAAASKSYNMNGLEVAHTFYNSPGQNQGWGYYFTEGLNGNYPRYSGIPNGPHGRWPIFNNKGQVSPTWLPTDIIKGEKYTAQYLPQIHLGFVAMWRGVFRTAVVDFPDTTLEIPAWNDDDFAYYRDGVKSLLPATQRIDLLVAYSLPADASATTLPDYSETFCSYPEAGVPKTLTSPTLGLIKGAGVSITRSGEGAVGTADNCPDDSGGDPVGAPPGTPAIVPNLSDQQTLANQGITAPDGSKVHGSFPSPDDLLNLAPLLALDLDDEDYQLVGGTALPIAYIVVNKDQATIVSNDILDIRPFLRTTEFTYNERAGVAAANPPLSFGNPAVGAYQLQRVVDGLRGEFDAGMQGDNDSGRAIYSDHIMGGVAYGVEGTLLTMNTGDQQTDGPFGTTTTSTKYKDPVSKVTYDFKNLRSSKNFLESTDLKLREAYLQYVYNHRQTNLKKWLSDPNAPNGNERPGTYLGLPEGNKGRNIPLYPEWDMPMNGKSWDYLMGTKDTNAQIPKVSWWMYLEAHAPERPIAFVPGGVISTVNASSRAHLSKRYGFGWRVDEGGSFLNIVSKKLQIQFPNWVNDYDVIVKYSNCGPCTMAMNRADAGGQGSREEVGLGNGLSVNKGSIITSDGGTKYAHIQITSASQNLPEAQSGMVAAGEITDKVQGGNKFPPLNESREYQWLSYTVVTPQHRSPWGTEEQATNGRGDFTQMQRFTPKFGAAYYPTVSFTVIGYTTNMATTNTRYNSSNNYTMMTPKADNGGLINNLLLDKAPLMETQSSWAWSPNTIIDIR